MHWLKLKYFVNRTAYDESAAWCHVPHGLKPLRLKKEYEIAEQKKHKNLVDPVGRDSWTLLQLLNVDHGFLKAILKSWQQNSGCITTHNFVKNQNVTNDDASEHAFGWSANRPTKGMF